MESFNKEILKIIPKLPFKVASYEPIYWKRVQITPIFIINTENDKYVLKLASVPTGIYKKLFNRIFGNLGLKNQVIVYNLLKNQKLSTFSIPKLVSSDSKSYLLFKYINIESNKEYEIVEDLIVKSLNELYLVKPSQKKYKKTTSLINLTRKPVYLIIRRVLGNLRRKHGINLVLKGLILVYKCHIVQNPFSLAFLIHNDFHHNNCFLDKLGRFYISDFENSVFDRRWVLVDIVHYSVGTQLFSINTKLIKMFFLKFKENNSNLNIDFRSQLLMALLLRISQMVLSTVPPKNVQKRYLRFFCIVLLNKNNFEKWISKNFSDFI
jgi:hypothetical protein